MPESLLLSINFPPFHPLHKYPTSFVEKPSVLKFKYKCSRPINYYTTSPRSSAKIGYFRDPGFQAEGLASLRKDGLLPRKRRRDIKVKFNNGFNGGGGKMNNDTARVLGNLALAILLTYLSMTGQLGWLLDAIVSLWLLAVLVPIVGIGAFLWWAGRDIVQGSCPNCGNEFQVFKSTLNDDLQLCPFCTQPFSVDGNEFVRDPVKFSNQSTASGQAFNDLSARTKKRKESSVSVVDVEAEIRDAD